MGCQRDIATKIIEKKAEYIVALKGNQGTLREDSRFSSTRESLEIQGRHDQHARSSRRRSRPYRDPALHDDPRSRLAAARHQWPGLNTVVVVESRREINGKITNETRFYLTSLGLSAAAVGPMIRAHWAIGTPCTGSWTWSSATTNAASEPTMPQPISPPAGTSPTTSLEKPRARIPSACAEKPQDGTTSISQVSSPRDFPHQYPDGGQYFSYIN